MQGWSKQFIVNHGERLFFMSLATCFGLGFIYLDMTGEGKTLLIAVATLALNKARGTLNNHKSEEVKPVSEK